MEIFSAANLGPRVRIHTGDVSRTKQAMRDEVDINLIMKRYVKTGLIDHFAQHGSEYGFASSVDFHEAMNVVTKADQMFDALPGKVRSRFGNDPAEFLDFVQNPENHAELVELGLAERKAPVAAKAVEPVVDPAAEIAPDQAAKPPLEPPVEEADTVVT